MLTFPGILPTTPQGLAKQSRKRMATIKCTNCGAVLKTQAPVAPGKKVKCPKCQEAFVVQADEEEKKPVREPEEEEEEAAGGEGEEEEETPKKKGKSADDEEGDAAEGEGEDEEEETPKKKGKGNGEPKKSNRNLILIIAAVVLLFCCCPSICTGVWWFAGAAIQTAIGIGGAAAQKKAIDDAFKKAQDDLNKTKK